MSPDATGRTLRILRAGICGTDLQIRRRIRPDAARTLGHEGVAEIHSETPSESDPRRRFTLFNPVAPHNQEHILGHSYDGIFQPAYHPDIIPGGGPPLVPAAPALVADLAILTEPIATVLYAWDLLTSAGPVGTVGVWGAGTTGLLAALVGELRGYEVELMHHRPARLDYVEHRHVLHRSRLRGRHSGWPAEERYDAAFLCLPREAAAGGLSEAVRHVRPGGVIDLFGGFGPGDRHDRLPGQDLGAIRRSNVCGRPDAEPLRAASTDGGKPLHLTGHRGTSRAHLESAQELLLRAPERFAPLVTHVVSLAELDACLDAMAASSGPSPLLGEYIKVAVDPTLGAAPARTPDTATPLGALSTTGAAC
ncbi:dehydrogenase [Streptomyces sp. NPDC050610]|uniref:dehydrogenase n=1 Tax=Streptomyces sp. NPDC050610 TaxID=3157097 RepID=UPI00343231B8